MKLFSLLLLGQRGLLVGEERRREDAREKGETGKSRNNSTHDILLERKRGEPNRVVAYRVSD
jgi:hypothetical protein